MYLYAKRHGHGYRLVVNRGNITAGPTRPDRHPAWARVALLWSVYSGELPSPDSIGAGRASGLRMIESSDARLDSLRCSCASLTIMFECRYRSLCPGTLFRTLTRCIYHWCQGCTVRQSQAASLLTSWGLFRNCPCLHSPCCTNLVPPTTTALVPVVARCRTGARGAEKLLAEAPGGRPHHGGPRPMVQAHGLVFAHGHGQ